MYVEIKTKRNKTKLFAFQMISETVGSSSGSPTVGNVLKATTEHFGSESKFDIPRLP